MFSSSILQFLFYPGVSVLLKVSCIHWLHVFLFWQNSSLSGSYRDVLAFWVFQVVFFSCCCCCFFLLFFLQEHAFWQQVILLVWSRKSQFLILQEAETLEISFISEATLKHNITGNRLWRVEYTLASDVCSLKYFLCHYIQLAYLSINCILKSVR